MVPGKYSVRPGNQIQLRKSTFLIITVNSAAIFLLSYFLVYFTTQLMTAISASAFNINSIIYYYNIDYLIRSGEWTSDAVAVVFSSGPVFSVFCALVLIIIYVKVVSETGLSRLFLLWCFCHFLINFFGNMLVGTILNEGFGYVIMYQFVMDTGKMIITLFAVLCIFLTGLFMSRLFLYSGNIYFNVLDHHNRRRFVIAQYILPFLLGDLIIFLLKLPEVRLFEILLNGCTLILLLPVLLRSSNMQDLYFDEDPKQIRLSRYFLLTAFLVMIVFRIGLGIGFRI